MMKIVRLVADLMLVEAQLRVAMRVEASAKTRASLVRVSAKMMDRIERHAPESMAELHEMIAFFSGRAVKLGRSERGQHDMDLAVSLMDRYKSQWLPAHADASPTFEEGPGEDRLATYVSHSVDRLVAIAPDYRYLATSPANATFNRTTQVGLIGQHLFDVVGPTRFHERGKPRLDACFNGKAQDYHYALSVVGQGERIIRCQMKPVGGGPAEIRYCSLMYMQDVTDIAMGLPRMAS